MFLSISFFCLHSQNVENSIKTNLVICLFSLESAASFPDNVHYCALFVFFAHLGDVFVEYDLQSFLFYFHFVFV